MLVNSLGRCNFSIGVKGLVSSILGCIDLLPVVGEPGGGGWLGFLLAHVVPGGLHVLGLLEHLVNDLVLDVQVDRVGNILLINTLIFIISFNCGLKVFSKRGEGGVLIRSLMDIRFSCCC